MRRDTMTKRPLTLLLTVLMFAAGIALGWWADRAAARRRPYEPPRAADGHPDLSGVWQALNRASWDLEAHAARPGPLVAAGALGAIPGGLGVVDGDEIPYQPWAADKKKENAANWLSNDPVVKCYLPGTPRATYMPFPFQIVQSSAYLLMSYEFASASRTIYLDPKAPAESGVDTWMGWSRGRWEHDTLVVESNSFNDQTWFDSAGDFHSDALHVTERYTRTGLDHLWYEATIQDPKVFTRPWTIRMPLYRLTEPNAQLVEFKCVEFVEELLYGKYRKQSAN
jgi:hypothetical protein